MIDKVLKGLKCCVAKEKGLTVKDCNVDCPYFHEGVFCKNALHGDTIGIIQQLEYRLAQAERERDAAVADLEDSADCEYCKNEIILHTCLGTNCHTCQRDCPCARCSKRKSDGFKWRGVVLIPAEAMKPVSDSAKTYELFSSKVMGEVWIAVKNGFQLIATIGRMKVTNDEAADCLRLVADRIIEDYNTQKAIDEKRNGVQQHI